MPTKLLLKSRPSFATTTNNNMPAIAAVQGFALRGQQPPPMASAFDVRADRSMGEMAWLVREAPTPSKRPSPYISIGGDMGRLMPAGVTRSLPRPATTGAPAPSGASTPPLTFAESFTNRMATPSSVTRLAPVPKTPSGYEWTSPKPVRRRIETYTGVPVYDGAAGYASSQLVRNRLLASSSSSSNMRTGKVFTMKYY